jgi:hypothetical protein
VVCTYTRVLSVRDPLARERPPIPFVAADLFVATQYEVPFKLNITTLHVSIMAITPAIAIHKVRHPSCNFSVFITKVRSKLVAAQWEP